MHFFGVGDSYVKWVDIWRGTSVFMSHGIADKGLGDAPYVSAFDYVFVSGPLYVKKLIGQGIPADKIRVVGYPKLDAIFQGKFKESPREDKRKIVLYAPTHSRSIASSYPAFMEFIDKLPVNLRVMVSLHPHNKPGKQPTLQELVDADVIISDSGSLLYEAWALSKPVVFPDWLVKDAVQKHWSGTFAARIFTEGLGYHARDIQELVMLLDVALKQGVGPRERDFIDSILPPELKGNSAKEAANVLLEIARGI